MDIYTAQEEAYKRGYEAGQRASWHYAKDETFRPEPGKYYCVRNWVGRATDGTPVLTEPKILYVGSHEPETIRIWAWYPIPME